jgi:hypothetical protein
MAVFIRTKCQQKGDYLQILRSGKEKGFELSALTAAASSPIFPLPPKHPISLR